MGELLIDFVPAGNTFPDNMRFQGNPGGAPANVLACLTKLGGSGAFIGMVGNDQFGHYLKNTLEENHIDTTGLAMTDEVSTTLAFVHLNERGDRSFSFYRNPGADIMLRPEQVKLELIENAKIFHFGSLSLTNQPARNATKVALEHAKAKGKIISFDPNWRPALWESEELAREQMRYGVRNADIVKLSDDELPLISGTSDLEEGTRIIKHWGAKAVLVTLGPAGCFFRVNGGVGRMDTYDTDIVDTTGSGDAFTGAFLYGVSRCGLLDNLNAQTVYEIIDRANAAGALCATKKGAIPAMPSKEEIERCQRSVSKLKIAAI